MFLGQHEIATVQPTVIDQDTGLIRLTTDSHAEAAAIPMLASVSVRLLVRGCGIGQAGGASRWRYRSAA